MTPANLQREAFPYTTRFCEENIWRLGAALARQGVPLAAMQALVLSNPAGTMAMLKQRAAPPGEVIVWDYHVILCLQHDGENWILDFDTRLPFATPRSRYLQSSFIPSTRLPLQYQPLLREVPMAEYLARFSSDRRHMLDESGMPLWPFPPEPCIQPADPQQAITLMQYIDMEAVLPGGSLVLGYLA